MERLLAHIFRLFHPHPSTTNRDGTATYNPVIAQEEFNRLYASWCDAVDRHDTRDQGRFLKAMVDNTTRRLRGEAQ